MFTMNLSPVLFVLHCEIQMEFNIRLNFCRRFSLSILGKHPSPLPARESNTIELLATKHLAYRIMITLNKAATVIHRGFYLLWDSAFVDSVCSVWNFGSQNTHCTLPENSRNAGGGIQTPIKVTWSTGFMDLGSTFYKE
jgi:hypothetical protein